MWTKGTRLPNQALPVQSTKENLKDLRLLRSKKSVLVTDTWGPELKHLLCVPGEVMSSAARTLPEHALCARHHWAVSTHEPV